MTDVIRRYRSLTSKKGPPSMSDMGILQQLRLETIFFGIR